jgi:hypothetical protein
LTRVDQYLVVRRDTVRSDAGRPLEAVVERLQADRSAVSTGVPSYRAFRVNTWNER